MAIPGRIAIKPDMVGGVTHFVPFDRGVPGTAGGEGTPPSDIDWKLGSTGTVGTQRTREIMYKKRGDPDRGIRQYWRLLWGSSSQTYGIYTEYEGRRSPAYIPAYEPDRYDSGVNWSTAGDPTSYFMQYYIEDGEYVEWDIPSGIKPMDRIYFYYLSGASRPEAVFQKKIGGAGSWIEIGRTVTNDDGTNRASKEVELSATIEGGDTLRITNDAGTAWAIVPAYWYMWSSTLTADDTEDWIVREDVTRISREGGGVGPLWFFAPTGETLKKIGTYAHQGADSSNGRQIVTGDTFGEEWLKTDGTSWDLQAGYVEDLYTMTRQSVAYYDALNPDVGDIIEVFTFGTYGWTAFGVLIPSVSLDIKMYPFMWTAYPTPDRYYAGGTLFEPVTPGSQEDYGFDGTASLLFAVFGGMANTRTCTSIENLSNPCMDIDATPANGSFVSWYASGGIKCFPHTEQIDNTTMPASVSGMTWWEDENWIDARTYFGNHRYFSE